MIKYAHKEYNITFVTSITKQSSMTITKSTIAQFITISAVSCIITYLVSVHNFKASSATTNKLALENKNMESSGGVYQIKRIQGFKYIQPLQYAEPENESSRYGVLKNEILQSIESYKNTGGLISASVYLRDFNKAEWMDAYQNDKFHPGSLMKMAVLITLLKTEEKHPGFIERKLILKSKRKDLPTQTFNSKQIETGKAYSIKELLSYMMCYSDNYATDLLHTVVDMDEYKRTYDYIGITYPNEANKNYQITAREYSSFMKVLYNASYLNSDHSEYAVELLTKCDFLLGFSAGFPVGTPIAHKFGEWGHGDESHELHEAGFIYLNNTAYLLVVMTKGKDLKKLPEIIAALAKIVYANIEDSSIPSSNSPS